MNSSAKKVLEKYKKDGFLFHGSPNEISSSIEPRQAQDVDKSNIFNNANAVFATDDYVMSMAYSLMNLKLLPIFNGLSCSINYNSNKKVIANFPQEWECKINKLVGYIYVLPKESFTETDGVQWKSQLPVEPVHRIRVTLKDYIKAGGSIKWN